MDCGSKTEANGKRAQPLNFDGDRLHEAQPLVEATTVDLAGIVLASTVPGALFRRFISELLGLYEPSMEPESKIKQAMALGMTCTSRSIWPKYSSLSVRSCLAPLP